MSGSDKKESFKMKDDIHVKFFHGERSKLRAYLIQVKLIHSFNPLKYSIELNKVLFTVTYLKEDV